MPFYYACSDHQSNRLINTIFLSLYTAYDPIYVLPLKEGHRFPMVKYELIPQQLIREGIIMDGDLHSPAKVSESIITETHDSDYWKRMRDLELSPAEIRRIGFPLTEELVDREQRIAQGTIDGCLFALAHGIAFNVAGGTHHAGTNWGEGFCLLNDQALAANYLLNTGRANRILIIDLDVHQGNGTAQIFKDEERVFTLSMHAQSNFPFRKERSDLDIGLEDGIADIEYLQMLKKHLTIILEEFKPDFIFYLAGVDVLATDKLGKLAISLPGCKERDKFVISQCHKLSIPLQVSMGGGYSPDIRHIVDAHCNTFRIAREFYA